MQENPTLTIPRARSWPPREGLSFFLLWIAGFLVQSGILTIWMWTRVSTGRPVLPTSNLHLLHSGLFALSFCLAAWQAFLLFQDRFRLIAWTLIGATPSGVVIISHSPHSPESIVPWILLQTGLLLLVRKRASLWVVIGFMAIILDAPYSRSVRAVVSPWLTQLFDQLGVPAPLTRIAEMNGVYLSSTLFAAAALAWWMPPMPTPGREPPQNGDINPV